MLVATEADLRTDALATVRTERVREPGGSALLLLALTRRAATWRPFLQGQALRQTIRSFTPGESAVTGRQMSAHGLQRVATSAAGL